MLVQLVIDSKALSKKRCEKIIFNSEFLPWCVSINDRNMKMELIKLLKMYLKEKYGAAGYENILIKSR